MEKDNRLYIVSFGNSRKYRVYADHVDNACTEDAASFLKTFLKKDYATLRGKKFLSTPTVMEVPDDKRAEYSSYPLLTDEIVRRDIAPLIGKEASVSEDVQMLNNNAMHSA